MSQTKTTPTSETTKIASSPTELTGRALAEAMHRALKTTLSTQEAAVQFLKGAGIVDGKGKLTKHYR